MAVIAAASLPDAQRELPDPQRALVFQCKCGCEMFRCDVEIYADYSWAAILACVACGQICTPTEPLTNGPH